MAGAGATIVFHKFQDLPPEIRLVVWEMAVKEDHLDRIVPLTEDHKRIVLVSHALHHPSGVFRADSESRGVALRLYDQALPVVPFFTLPSVHAVNYTILPPPQEGPVLDRTHDGRSFVHVSFSLDIFLVSARTAHFHLNKSGVSQWRSLESVFPDAVHPTPGPNALPRHMTWPLPPAMRAQIERLMEVNLVLGPAAPGQPVEHRFHASEFPSVRECIHRDGILGLNLGVNTRRVLWHLSQDYTSAELLEWLNAEVCSV